MSDRAVGYVRARVIPRSMLTEYGNSSAQAQSILAECERRGWILDEMFVDRGASANDPNRPGLTGALELLAAGEHIGLVVTGLDRLARRAEILLAIKSAAAAARWELVVASS